MRLHIRRLRDWTFWHYQAVGWPIFALAHVAVNTAVYGFSWTAVTNLLLQVFAGFLLSLVLREYFRRVPYHQVSLPSIVVRIILGALAMTTVWYGALILIQIAYFGPAIAATYLQIERALRVIALIYPEKLVWGSLYFGIKFWRDWIIERERAEKAEEEIQQTQLQTLRYQLNPHFLFNALNSLRALIDEDSQQARKMLTELSEFLRYSLVSRNRSDVLLRDEVQAVRHYLSIEKQRYEEKLTVAFDVQPETEEYPMLSFLIHPLVENAVKYGMQTSPMPLRIWIDTRLHGGSLRIAVRNTGRWLPRPPNSHTAPARTESGLENVRARLDHAFPQQYALETFERDGCVNVVLDIHYDHELAYEEKVTSDYR
jgi:two-component system LytT family sensor kinase